MDINRSIDVIIPVYKPDKKLERLLEMLSKQTWPVQKIILMNTGEMTFPSRLLGIHPFTELYQVELEDFDHGGTRQRAAGYSQAGYLLYMTQDAVPADCHLVEQLAKCFLDARVKVAYARQVPRDGCRELERYTRSFNYPPQSRVKTREDLPELGIKTFFCSNVCAMYERKAFEELGGFVRHTIFNEDMIYAGGLIQAGYGIAYQEKAQVIHSHNYSGWQQLRRNFDLAVSQVEHPEIFSGIPSEGEGLRMIKQVARQCIRAGKPWLLGELLVQSGCKFLGYRLGKIHRKLPPKVVRLCTMSPHYWNKN
ncbi:MAG: glycosyltransferase [Lachnospiraceae bacterium]|nr:glycosyltransferase [Lachnospiraceae bacterium]